MVSAAGLVHGSSPTRHLLETMPGEGPLAVQLFGSNEADLAGASRIVGEFVRRDGDGRAVELNLNAGCPSGMVVAKHKGAGMLADLDTLAAFLDEVFARCPLAVSVKTRMGVNSTAEFPKILALYNRYPLKELIVHARDRAGMYQSAPDVEGFAAALRDCRSPICYNGNVFTKDDLERLQTRLTTLRRVMLGRGAAADPALFRVLREGRALEREELREFHAQLLEEALADGLAPVHALARIKELWFYFSRLFPHSEKPMKAIYKARALSDYHDAAERLFDEAAFDPARGFGG